MFIDGINMDHVHRIETRKIDGEWKTYAFYVDETAKRIKGDRYDIEKFTSPVIPANPGFFVLQSWIDNGVTRVAKWPVVAWRIYEGTPCAITIDDIEGPILMPDGRVIEQFGEYWQSIDEWRSAKHEEPSPCADARLIAAASYLLAELESIANADPRKWPEQFRDQFQEWAQSRARAAIAKAKEPEPCAETPASPANAGALDY